MKIASARLPKCGLIGGGSSNSPDWDVKTGYGSGDKNPGM